MLNRLAKEDKRWYGMALSICGDEDLSRDLVQEMYLRIHKYVKDESKIIEPDGSVNAFYIYVTIKNVFFKRFNDKKRMPEESIDEEWNKDRRFRMLWNDPFISESVDEVDRRYEEELSFQRVVDRIMLEAKEWHWYDEKLFKLYFLTDMSLRDVANETKISLTSIYNSIKNYKKFMLDMFAEDVEDYYNGDYDKI